jgi:uncharacterized protein
MPVFERTTEIPCSAAALFRWHAAPLAFDRLAPPWERIRVRVPLTKLEDGATTTLATGFGPLELSWTARIEDVRDGTDGKEAGFVDVQQSGPFGAWRHEHRFLPIDAQRCTLHDRITYELPKIPGSFVASGSIEERLTRTFRFRHDTTRLDVELQNALPKVPQMRVLITGASGLLGTEIRTLLSVLGHTPLSAVRREARAPDEVAWDVSTGRVDAHDAIDAVIHLAGEPIDAGRLDEAHLARVRESRTTVTRKLITGLAALKAPPRVFVCASGIAFYGDAKDTLVDEDSARGAGLLADVVVGWEDAAATAETHGMRRVSVRTGLAMSPRGGALARQLPAFLAGVAGPLAGGAMVQPYLAIDDVAAIYVRALLDERLRGPVNAVPREAPTNRAFTKTLAHVLGRPAVMPVPAFALRTLFGRLADEGLLSSCRAAPTRIRTTGHAFRHATVEAALRHVLGRYAG